MKWTRRHLTFANVISMMALFVALGGTGYAATKLAKNSVGAKQVKKNAVGASEIKANAVRASEVRANAVRGGEIADGAVGAADIGDNGVGGSEIADNAVGGAEIANDAVSSSEIVDGGVGTNDVTNGSLLAGDFAPDQLGPTAFARIAGDGTLVGGAAQQKSIDVSMIQKNVGAPAGESTGPGIYCIGGLGFTPRGVMVSLDNTDALPAVPAVQGGSLNFIPSAAVFKGEDLGRCDAAHGQVRVAIERVDQTNPPELVDHGFFVWIQG